MVSDSELNFKEHITVTLCNTATICNSFVTHFVTIIRWTGIQDADLQLKTRELESEAPRPRTQNPGPRIQDQGTWDGNPKLKTKDQKPTSRTYKLFDQGLGFILHWLKLTENQLKFLFSHLFVVSQKIFWRSFCKTFWGTTKKCF